MMKKSKEDKKPIEPPTVDVRFDGCNPDCGYYIPVFYKSANGEYDDVDKVKCFCQYQHQEVRKKSKCPYAEDHPDQLRKSLWD